MAWFLSGGWLLIVVGVLTVIAAILLVRVLGNKSKGQDPKSELFKRLAESDNLITYVEDWRSIYARNAKNSQTLYYTFTAIALLSTSLVTAVGAVGTVWADHAGWLLIITTFLGFVATVATGIDRMLNDRKDFIRFGRYAVLLELAGFKYAASLIAPENGRDSDARKLFIELASKLRADETSDWIQDETSATVDAAGAGAANARTTLIAKAAQDVHGADAVLKKAKAESDQADQAVQDADTVRADAQKARDDALGDTHADEAAKTAAETALAQAQKDHDDKQIVANQKKTDLQTAQDALTQKKDTLDKLMEQPQP